MFKNALAAVGNYGEIYARHLEPISARLKVLVWFVRKKRKWNHHGLSRRGSTFFLAVIHNHRMDP